MHRYTLARVAKFPFIVGDKDIDASVAKLVEAIRLAKQVSEKSERLKFLREEVVGGNKKLAQTEVDLKDFKQKLVIQKTKKVNQHLYF